MFPYLPTLYSVLLFSPRLFLLLSLSIIMLGPTSLCIPPLFFLHYFVFSPPTKSYYCGYNNINDNLNHLIEGNNQLFYLQNSFNFHSQIKKLVNLTNLLYLNIRSITRCLYVLETIWYDIIYFILRYFYLILSNLYQELSLEYWVISIKNKFDSQISSIL